MLSKPLTLLFKAVFLPPYLLVRLVEELTGEARWYRRQYARMVEERPPLSDADFLAYINPPPADTHLWLAVRAAVAESTGLPAESLYPTDPLEDLLRMQFFGPDHLDLIFRLERTLHAKLPRHASPHRRLTAFPPTSEFQDLADLLVTAAHHAIPLNARC